MEEWWLRLMNGGGGMTLLGSAQHQRLVDPNKQHQYNIKMLAPKQRTGEGGRSHSLPAGASSEAAVGSSPSTCCTALEFTTRVPRRAH